MPYFETLPAVGADHFRIIAWFVVAKTNRPNGDPPRSVARSKSRSPPKPGSPNPGSPNPGSPNPGSPKPGSPNPGSPNPGSPDATSSLSISRDHAIGTSTDPMVTSPGLRLRRLAP